MKYYPQKEDYEEVEELQPEDWMLDLLKMNPPYCGWDPQDDYMSTNKERGYNSSLIFDNWNDSIKILDDLNEVVNFYFEICRESSDCIVCGGCGYHPDAQWIIESFYSQLSPFCAENYNSIKTSKVFINNSIINNNSLYPKESILKKYSYEFREFCEQMKNGLGFWSNSLKKEDYDILEKKGRTYNPFDPLPIDAISRNILCKARCERMGIPFSCYECDGNGFVYTEENCHVEFVFWLIHPRKGASRGVRVKKIEQHELPEIYEFLRNARERNADRFGKIPDK